MTLRLRGCEAIALGLLLLLGVPGCRRHETAVSRGDREQVLYRSLGYEVTGLDPQLVTGIAEASVVDALFEGLVREDPRDLHPIPGAASSWTVSPDGLTYTFHLRPGARWSDGRPVTAQDFVASWRRILTPSLASENASLLYVLRGAEAFHRGQTRDFSSVGARAPDARTLVVSLGRPTPNFLTLLTHWAWLPVPLPEIAADGPPDSRSNAWARPGRLVGNGAFLLADWRPGREIVLRRSPTYWDAGAVRLREVHAYPIDSLPAEAQAFRAGQIHITDALPEGEIGFYRREMPQCLRIDPYLGTYYYCLNTRLPGLDDPRVRRALALALDRDAIASRLLRGGQLPAHAFTPPGIAGYVPPEGIGDDPGEARRLLAEAGHPGGRGLPVFDLLYNSSENHRRIAEAVQEMWRRELGVEVRLVSQELKVVQAERRTGDFQILRADWIADYADPATFLDIWRGGSGNNYSGWSSPAYDAALDRAERTADPALRLVRMRQAERILLAAVPCIPVYHYTHAFLIRPSVRGWYPNVLDHHPLQAVWLKGSD